MSVRSRGSTFQVDFSFKSQRIRQDGFKSHDAATAWETQARAKLARGEGIETSTVGKAGEHCTTLKQLLHLTIARHWAGSKGESTTVKNAEDCVSFFGESLHPRKVSAAGIDQMIAHFLGRGLQNSTVNRKLAALSRMLTFAHSRGWIEQKPPMEKKPESQHRVRWFSDKEERLVVGYFQKIGQNSMADFIEFLIDTGLRLSEGLRLEEKDSTDGYVRVWINKADHPRSVPMTKRVKALVAKRLQALPAGETRVFWDLNVHRCEYLWKAMREQLGFQTDTQFVIHVCRHTFGSRLVQAGVSLQVVQQLMGHKTITVTQRYAHLAAANLVSAIAALNNGSSPISLADTSQVTSRAEVTPIQESVSQAMVRSA